MERKEEFQQLNQNIINDANVDEECKIENVKNNAILELERIGPHSKHFSTLWLAGDMRIDPVEHMKESMDEEQNGRDDSDEALDYDVGVAVEFEDNEDEEEDEESDLDDEEEDDVVLEADGSGAMQMGSGIEEDEMQEADEG
uniref:Ribosomal RNA processing protein 1 homolog n=1 Tax=Nicotiana tabacum TaxID=4097 RepID=A0A1S3YL60_TOBAC|nr:PREDICTED: ribosomal RNA processing protein 1 homolog [Nicotiana tabacum]